MKISNAFRNAFRAVLSHKAAAVKFLVVEGCLTGMCLVPLLFLTEQGPMKYCSGLSAVLWLFLMMPARMNAAAAMQDSLGNGSLFSLRLADLSGYGKKLRYGIGRCLLLLIWGAPLIAALLYAWEQFSGSTDGLTVMQKIHDFGGKDMKTGIIYLILILLGLILLLVFGIAFHGGDRHAYTLEQKNILKGHRGKMVLCWFCSLVFLLPLLLAGILVILRYAPLLNNVSGVLSGSVEKPSTRVSLMILAAGAVLTLPLLPLRSMVPAAFVSGLVKE